MVFQAIDRVVVVVDRNQGMFVESADAMLGSPLHHPPAI
jgi:hypothetical protein